LALSSAPHPRRLLDDTCFACRKPVDGRDFIQAYEIQAYERLKAAE
jgi:hypothetical protein